MPKGKRKGGRKSTESRHTSDEEIEAADNWSTASVLSEDMSGSIPEEEGTEGVDESSAQDNFEDKLKDAIEGLTQKSAGGRKTCMQSVINALSNKCLYDFLLDRKVTLCDPLLRCLKKGKSDEQALAAKCISLFCVQMGEEADEVMQEARPALLALLADKTASVKARGECAIAVALSVFISSSDTEIVQEVLQALENIFSLSFRKGDKTVPNHAPDICRFHSIALTEWCLLLTIAPQFLIDQYVLKYLSRFPDMLESQDVELRITAGETVALFFELGREEDEEFESDAMVQLCDTLRRMSTESHKYWAKKDCRLQKSSFREILRTVEEGDAPKVTVKFATETLEIFSWVQKMQYNALCQALQSGIYQHLQWNSLVRDVFGLGAPIIVSNINKSKPSKWERAMYNAAAFRARTKARSKFRDKRSVTVNGFD